MATGKLFLVIGARGVGRRSILVAARDRLRFRRNVAFATTDTTAEVPQGAFQGRITPSEFANRVARKHYMLFWRAHGAGFGIPRHFADALLSGGHLIASAAPDVLPIARLQYPNLHVIGITCSPRELRQRLRDRGDPAVQIDEWVREAEAFAPDAHANTLIDNSATIDFACEEFVATINEHTPRRLPFSA